MSYSEFQEDVSEQKVFRYPISDYNDVVELYNTSEVGQKLIQLSNSRLYMYVYQGIGKLPGKIVISIGFLILPIINFGMLIALICSLHFLNKQYKKHRRNLKIIPNPFENFVKEDTLCQKLGKHYTKLELSVRDVEGFTFNSRINKSLMERSVNGKIQVVIYDKEFHKAYYGLRTYQIQLIAWISIGILFTMVSTFFYLSLIVQF